MDNIIIWVFGIGIAILFIFLFTAPNSKKTTTYAFQVYDNLGKYIYTKRVNAKSEQEACSKIERYIPKDYTYKIVFP